MIDNIGVDEAVWALRPDFVALVVCAYGLRNGPTGDRERAWLREAEARAVPRDHPHLEAWRETYRAFGAKPKRTRPSVEALIRRTPLPEINRVVDAYNAVSVEHGLPVGGEDLRAYQGPSRLVRAAGDEPFDTTEDGEPVVDQPEIGEVVWRDDRGVTCRRWNWRQCRRTRITEETTDALFLFERLEPLPLDALRAAGDDLVVRLREVSPGIEVHTRHIQQGRD